MTFIDEHIDDTDFFDESKFDTYVPTTDMFRRAPRACAGRRLCSGARDSGRSRPFRCTGAAPRRCLSDAHPPR